MDFKCILQNHSKTGKWCAFDFIFFNRGPPPLTISVRKRNFSMLKDPIDEFFGTMRLLKNSMKLCLRDFAVFEFQGRR